MSMTPEFLKWFADTVPLTAKMARAGDTAAAGSRSIAWSGWQASRAAIVVELPDPYWPKYVDEDEPGLAIAVDLYTKDQILSLLTVKP